uniref:Centrosomal protein of 70 kDa n=1 Tax=Malurus cyaneus samueli TaxID=2593467 RepID=A0A8C5TQ67_9PASS
RQRASFSFLLSLFFRLSEPRSDVKSSGFCLFFSFSQLQQERVEWENLNKILMRHGLKPVSLFVPQSNRNTSDMIVLDGQSSQGIRLALKTLAEDIERQQKVMQGLMEANRCLRDVVRLEQGRASRQEQRAKELEIVVKNVKAKICQLEDEAIAKACQQQNQVKELQKDQQASQVIRIALPEDSNFSLMKGLKILTLI